MDHSPAAERQQAAQAEIEAAGGNIAFADGRLMAHRANL
jgi:prepilin-type processing-associated H-X9-DG protein